MTDHILVKNIPPRIQYVADGENKTFEFPFIIFHNTDLKVYVGEELQNKNFYTISTYENSTGGSITFEVAPVTGNIVTLVRELPIERTSDFQEGSSLRADALNYEFDYQVACQQQIADNLNRSMVLPPYATGDDVNLTLPLPSAGKAIVWNSDGTNLENSTVEVNKLEITLKEYKTSAENSATAATLASSAAKSAAQTASTAAANATSAAATVANKADKDLGNAAANLDFVTESYGPDENGSWYRIYKSGWIEQGGRYQSTDVSNIAGFATINLFKPYNDKNYTINLTSAVQNYFAYLNGVGNPTNYNVTATSFVAGTMYVGGSGYLKSFYWTTTGKGA